MQSIDHNNTVGFEALIKPLDENVQNLYLQYGLSKTPTLKDIEPVATVLLCNTLTLTEGMSLVLGRTLYSEDIQKDEMLQRIYLTGDGKTKFALLIMYKSLNK